MRNQMMINRVNSEESRQEERKRPPMPFFVKKKQILEKRSLNATMHEITVPIKMQF